MQESKLLGTLLPSSPDLLPIVRQLRAKYGLPELGPDDEPIAEVFLDGEPVALEDFHQEIRSLVQALPDLLPPEVAKTLGQLRGTVGKPLNIPWLGLIPESDRNSVEEFYKLTQKMGEFFIRAYGQFDEGIADMLYEYILTGGVQEIPNDWISKVFRGETQGEPFVMAMASQVADPEAIVQRFREECRAAFGAHHPNVTKIMVGTGYYLRLKKAGKPWNFIVEEFIMREKILLPRERHSQRYMEIWRRSEQRLKKRMQRCETVLSVLLRDKKQAESVP